MRLYGVTIMIISLRAVESNDDVMDMSTNGFYVLRPNIKSYSITRNYNGDLDLRGVFMSDPRAAIYANGTSLFVWCKLTSNNNDHTYI